MRLLDLKHIEYRHYSYEYEGEVPSGLQVAEKLGLDPRKVFKTLVTVGKSKDHYVFVIPVGKELELKLVAGAVGEKSIEMIKSKELLGLTGYVHGGCSPIGMKKAFRTVFDESAHSFESIIFSAGRIGRQVELKTEELAALIGCEFAVLCN